MASTSRLITVSPFTAYPSAVGHLAFTTRRVPPDALKTVISGTVRPRSGDLVLAEVRRLGHHKRLELANGRRFTMHVGDLIVVAYADRYAPDQFESHVPDDLGAVQLVASGGIASKMLSRSADVRSATDIRPIGLVGDERGTVINVADFGLPASPEPVIAPRTIAVIGTSMNSGKTTTVRYLGHSLSKAGHRVGATKVTGTGSGGDYWVMIDAGMHSMLDFTDVGMASTYRQPMQAVENAMNALLNATAATGVGVTLVEVADGIYQQETSRLLDSQLFHDRIDAVVFAAADSMGAAAGVRHLTRLGHDVLAVSGRLTRAPLAAREAAKVIGLPVLGINELSDPALIEPLLGISPRGSAAELAVAPPAEEEAAASPAAEPAATPAAATAEVATAREKVTTLPDDSHMDLLAQALMREMATQ